MSCITAGDVRLCRRGCADSRAYWLPTQRTSSPVLPTVSVFFGFSFLYYLSVFSLRALDEAGYQSTRAT